MSLGYNDIEREAIKRVREIVEMLCVYHGGQCGNCQCVNQCYDGDADKGKDRASTWFVKRVLMQTWRKKT